MAMSKKKKKKNLLMLLLLLVLCIGVVVGIVLLKQQNQKEDIQETTTEAAPREFCLQGDVKEIVKVSYAKDGEEFSFVRKDASSPWEKADDAQVSVSQSVVNAIVSSALDVVIYGEIEKGGNRKDFGLEPAQSWVSLTDTKGEVKKLLMGDSVPGNENFCYAVVDGTDRIVRVIKVLYNKLETDPKLIYSMDVYPTIEKDSIVDIDYTGRNGQIHLINDPKDLTEADAIGTTFWYYPYKDRYMAASYDEMIKMLDQIVGVTYETEGRVELTEEAMKGCGLEEPTGTLAVRYKTEDESEQTLQLVIGGLTEDGTGYYVRQDNGKTAYVMKKEALSVLTDHNPTDYMMNRGYALCNFDGIDHIEVKVDGKTMTMQVKQTVTKDEKGEEKKTYECFLNGEPYDEKETRGIFADLIRPTADHIMADGEATEAEIIMSYTYYLNYPERPERTIQVAPLDSTYYQVAVDGDWKYAVTKQEYNALMNHIQDYLK